MSSPADKKGVLQSTKRKWNTFKKRFKSPMEADQLRRTTSEMDIAAGNSSHHLAAGKLDRPTSAMGAATSGLFPSASPKSSVLQNLNNALKSLHQGARVFPPLQAAIEGVVSCVEAIEFTLKNRSEFEEITFNLTALSHSLAQHLQESKSPQISEFIQNIATCVEEQVTVINNKRERGTGRYLVAVEQDEDEILRVYRRIEGIFRLLQTEASLKTWSIAEEQLAGSRLEALTPSDSATYNSLVSLEVNRRACTKDTRTQVLHDLNNWSFDPNAAPIYWMNGMAGTGKTTVAYTFAKSLKARRALGASFFCTRISSECRDVGRIIPTIAYQLAQCSSSFRSALLHVLEQDPKIGSQTIADQCERLIKEPLLSAKEEIKNGTVVVIDALDECSNANGVGMILDVLFKVSPSLPIKFFVTSRPEPEIYNRVQKQPKYSRSVCVLHEIERSLVQADIELYLYDELGGNAITDAQLKRLAELSGSLFIYAATAVRYIRRVGTTVDQDRLKSVLNSSQKARLRHNEIDSLYNTILSAAVAHPSLEEYEQKQMLLLLWTAVCAREPINVVTLASLADVEAEKANILLQSLYSVLHVSDGTRTVSTLHASFPDYMFDKSRSESFYCDETQHSQLLGKQCFAVMKDQLRFNICDLESSSKPDSEVQDMQDRIAKAISPTL
ncbi:unnamed protein product, partial [Rhizoctonia solani]